MFSNNLDVGGNLKASVIAQGGVRATALPIPTGLAVGVGSGDANLPGSPPLYYYKVSAFNNFGETLPFAEVS